MNCIDIADSLDIFFWILCYFCCSDLNVFCVWKIRYAICLVINLIEIAVMIGTFHANSEDRKIHDIFSDDNLIFYIFWFAMYIISLIILLLSLCIGCSSKNFRISLFHISELCMVVLEAFTIGFSYMFAKQEGKSVQDYSSDVDKYRSVIFILSIEFGTIDLIFFHEKLTK
jgi:hypothetical protein